MSPSSLGAGAVSKSEQASLWIEILISIGKK